MRQAVLGAAALCAACTVSIDPGSLPCRNDGECPTGAYCTPAGKCATTPAVCPAPSVRVGDSCQTPPAAPTGLQATASSSVTLTWAAAADAASWIVQRSASSSGPFSQEFTTSTHGYTDTGVAPGTQVYYQVVAVSLANLHSAPSAVVSALTLPAAPGGLTAVGQTGSVRLSWTVVAGADSYTVVRGSTTIASGLAETAYTDTGLAAGATFQYSVQAVNATGPGAASTASALTAPGTPAALQAALDPQKTGIVVTWDRSPGAESYDVFRGLTAGGMSLYRNVADPGTGAQATLADTSPDRGVADFYAVLAKNASGASGLSGTASAVTIPAAPGGVTASSTGGSGPVTVGWNPVPGAANYAVVRNATTLTSALPPTAPFVYSDPNPGAGGTYAYAVFAINATGNGTASVPAGPSTVTLAPDAPVLSVTSRSFNGTATTINFSWTRPPGATSYDLFRDVTKIKTTADPADTASDVESAPATTYSYTVVASNAGGAGPASAPVAVTTVPATPTGLSIDGQTTSTVSLSWDAMPTAASYLVTRNPGGGGFPASVPAPAPGVTRVSLVDTGASPSTAYDYAVASVSAVDASGTLTSLASSPKQAITLTPPPANPSAAPVDDTHVAVSWDSAVAGVDGYDVFRGVSAGNENLASPLNGGTPVGNPADGSRITFTDSTAAFNTRYYYKVQARHDAAPVQKSDYSGESSALTYFPAPTGLAAGSATDSALKLTFNANPPGAVYTFDVLRGLASGQQVIAGTCAGTAVNPQSCDDPLPSDVFPLAQNVSYYYRVRVHDPVSGNVSLPGNEAIGTTTNVSAPSFSLSSGSPTTVTVTVAALNPGYDLYDFFESQSSTPGPAGATPPTFTITSISGVNAAVTRTVASGTWFYWARARWSGDVTQITPWSASPAAIVTSPAVPPVPLTPTNFRVQAAGAGQVQLQWNASANATSYDLVRDGAVASPINVTTPYYTDKGLADASSHTYTVAARSSAGASTPTSPLTANLASAATSFVCSPARTTSTYSDSPTVKTILSFQGVSWVQPGPGTAAPLARLGDGNCLATGLPASPAGVFIIRGPHYIFTTGRSMDLSNEFYGRNVGSGYGAFTPVSFSIGNLSPWTASSHIELFASNTNVALFNLEQATVAGLPSPGDTSLTGFLVDVSQSGSFIDTSLTPPDKPVLIEMNPLVSTNGFPYLAATRSLNIPSMSAVGGRPLSVSSSLTDLAPYSPTTFKYLRSQFKAPAIVSAVNPAASGAANDTVVFSAVPKDAAGVGHAFSGPAADVASITFDTGTGDVDMGTIQLPDPYPTWFHYATVSAAYNTPVGCGPGKTPAVFTSGLTIIDSTSNILASASSGGIGKQLTPVTNPQIQPTSGGPGFVDLFHDRTGVTTTPTLQWTVPGGLPAPNYVRIFLYKIAPDATNTCVPQDNFGNPFFSLAQLYMTGAGTMTMTFPPNVLVAGSTYFAVIRSTYEPGRDITGKPFIRAGAEYLAETVTNTFTP